MKHIMVVDDSESDLFLCQHIIEAFDNDVTVIEAFDGRQALDILSETDNQPDVILLDINMPVMDGHEFLERYSALGKQQTVIAMLSSSDHDKDKIKSHSYDFVKLYLRKPLSADDLEEIKKLHIGL